MKTCKLFALLATLTLSSFALATGGVMPGSGTPQNPYLIEDLGDFEEFCADSSYRAEGVYTSLACQLNLSSKGTYEHAPIDDFDAESNRIAYQGHFNGNGHTISNLTINNEFGDHFGLFAEIGAGGSVSNLNLSNVIITGKNNNFIGSLAGANSEGLVSNCSATYSIATNTGEESWCYYTGGLIGKNTGRVTGCRTEGTISGGEYVGGLIGHSESELDTGFISDCTTDSVVSGYRDIGGLIGYSETRIFDCSAKSRVTAGGARCGGLAGYVGGDRRVDRCSAESTVNGVGSTGGLIGYLENGWASDCYAAGTVSGDSRTGGLIGNIFGLCSDCYSTADVTGNEYVGAIFGYLSGQKAQSCFWNSDLSDQGIGYLASSSFGDDTHGITTAQFADINTFRDAGWGFNMSGGYQLRDVWVMDDTPLLCRSIEQQAEIAVGSVQGLDLEAAEAKIAGAGYVCAGTSFLYSDIIPQGLAINAVARALSDNTDAEFEFYVNMSLGAFTGLGGDGSEEKPFLIQNLGDFVEFCMTDNYYQSEPHTAFTADIDCMSLPIFAESPIGSSWYLSNYSGVFDGCGHNIRNLTVSDGGLFYKIRSTTIVKNLGLVNVNAKGGALSTTCYGTISQCFSSGLVSGGEETGGLVGYMVGSLIDYSASDCYSTCDVAGKGSCGGLFGKLGFYTSVANCYSSGAVSSETGGGFCGELQTTEIYNCFWNMDSSGLSNGYFKKITEEGSLEPAGLTASETLEINTFTDAGWDFAGIFKDGIEDIWIMDGSPILAWQVLTPQADSLADITGLTEEEARAAVTESGLILDDVIYVYDDAIAGSVVNYSVSASGNSAEDGLEAVLLVSLGEFTGLAGSGTAEEPYLIQSLGDFNEFCADSSYWAYGLHTKLTTDINLALSETYSTSPISPHSQAYESWNYDGVPFRGVFNGNNHTIRNFKLHYGSYNGLFGKIGSRGVVCNLNITDATVVSDSYTGILAGIIANGSIYDCSVSGYLNGSDYVGGLAGWIEGGKLSGCKSSGVVTGKSYTGGLVGKSIYSTNSWRNSYVTGCGSDCDVYGGLDSNYNSCIGGLIGINRGAVTGCYFTGTVKAMDYVESVGGLIGVCEDYYGAFVSNCCFIGKIKGGQYITFAGGIVGSCKELTTITECYAECNENMAFIFDPIAATTDRAVIDRCFWNSDLASGENGIGLTTGQIQDINTFLEAGWDFSGETDNGTRDLWIMGQTPLPARLHSSYAELSDIRQISLTQAQDILESHGVNVSETIYTYSYTEAGTVLDCSAVPESMYISENPAVSSVCLLVSQGESKPLAGSGTEQDPYLIQSLGDFDVFCSNANYWSAGVYTELTCDINLLLSPPHRKAPIASSTTAYKGHFNGNFHSISNLIVSGEAYCGLFGKTGGGSSVSRLIVNSAKILAISNNNGGIASVNAGGTITQCSVSGHITGEENIGGIVGLNTTSLNGIPGTIASCQSSCYVFGYYTTGGIAGYMEPDSIMTNCYCTVHVKGNNSYVGGLAGRMYQSTISNSYSRCIASEDTQGYGALVGYCETSEVLNCFWDEGITSTGIYRTSEPGTIMASGVSSDEMQDISLFINAGWDFGGEEYNGTEEIWLMGEYPVLTWQITGSRQSPDYTGMTLGDALSAMEETGTSVGAVVYVYGSQEAGMIEQNLFGLDSMYASADITNGTKAYLAVSLGEFTGFEGAGTAEAPFLIRSTGDFNEYCKDSALWAPDVHAAITSDISLLFNDYDAAPVSPCIDGVFEQPFKASLDGCGHAISALNITGGDYCGLIGKIGNGGIVSNLMIEHASIKSAGTCSGALAGLNAGGTIVNCHASGTVSGSLRAGGLLGENAFSFAGSRGLVSKCSAACTTSGNRNIGGLVGRNGTDINLSSSNGMNFGITNIGGIAGICIAGSTIESSYSTGTSSGNYHVGGIAGFTDESTITEVYSACKINCDIGYFGAITGANNNCVITSSFWNKELCENSGAGDFTAATGLTTAQMQDEAVFIAAGWDFATPVWIISSCDYPKLALHLPDYNSDGYIDVEDLLNLSENWLTTDKPLSSADLTGDGDVNNNDLRVLAESWLSGS
ncbi:MAG: GLUG motif-containing protein [Phycisphaerae bacterium]